MTEYTDVTNHHIEGYTEAGYVKIPLITEVLPDLWVGGCVGGCKLADDFDIVFSMYQWEEYILGPDTERVTVEMYDSSATPDKEVVDGIAQQVLSAWRSGKKVLVHCQAGLNRSNLITARALILNGSTPDNAIKLLREKRDAYVLCNSTFESWLRNTEVN